jgi:hypothetical protein
MRKRHVSFYCGHSTERQSPVAQPRTLSEMLQQRRSDQSFPEPRPGKRPRQHPALWRPAVAHSMLGFAEDPTLGSGTNLGLPHCPSLVGSSPPKLPLRLAIAQSLEQLVSKDFEPLQALAKTRGRQPERQSILSREVGARSCQPTPERGRRRPRPQPQRARRRPMPFASAAVEAGSAAELLS